MALVDDNAPVEQPLEQAVSLDDVIIRLDALGKQMDWLCETIGSLATFAQQLGQNGGGIRGLMKTMSALNEGGN